MTGSDMARGFSFHILCGNSPQLRASRSTLKSWRYTRWRAIEQVLYTARSLCMDEHPLVQLDTYIGQLVQLYEGQVYAYALHLTHNHEYDAKDITWQAYERTYIYLRSKPGRQILQPRNWLFTTVKNIYLNSLRGKMRSSTDSLEYLQLSSLSERDIAPMDVADATHLQPEIVAENNENLREVSRHIAALPKGVVRDAVFLNVLEEYSCPEISDQLNRPLGTIKASVHQGKAELRERLMPWKNEGK